MKKKYFLVMLLLIIFFYATSSLIFGQEQDISGSSDHPLLSRMDNYYIDEYAEYDYDSHEFYDEEDHEYIIEGYKWIISYTLKEGYEPPGQLEDYNPLPPRGPELKISQELITANIFF